MGTILNNVNLYLPDLSRGKPLSIPENSGEGGGAIGERECVVFYVCIYRCPNESSTTDFDTFCPVFTITALYEQYTVTVFLCRSSIGYSTLLMGHIFAWDLISCVQIFVGTNFRNQA